METVLQFAEIRRPFIPYLAAMSCAILVVTLVACGGDGNGGSATKAAAGGDAASGGGDNLQIRSPFDDYGNAVTVDASGNVYIAGHIAEALPGQTYAGGTDAFVQKLDGSFTEVVDEPVRHRETMTVSTPLRWTARGTCISQDGRSASSRATPLNTSAATPSYGPTTRAGPSGGRRSSAPSTPRSAQSIAVDSSGNVYVGGHTEGSLPGFENAGGAPLGPVSEWNDAFVRKYASRRHGGLDSAVRTRAPRRDTRRRGRRFRLRVRFRLHRRQLRGLLQSGRT